MKKRLFRNLLLVLALGLMLSYSSVGVFAASSATDAGAGFDSEWRLKVDGSVNNPLSLSINDLAAMPQTVVYAELYIYGNLVASGNWGGVRLQLLLEKAACEHGVRAHAFDVEFHSSDGYKITGIQQENLIIAYERDGQPLPERLRLVVPGADGNVWIAMITKITVVGLDPVPVTPQSAWDSSSPQEPSAPALTPQQLENQSATQPAVTPTDSQSVTQLDAGSGLPLGFDYAVVGVFVAVLVVMTGYLAWKRKKTS